MNPGMVLTVDLLGPLGMSINKLATELHVPANRLSQIIGGKHGIISNGYLRGESWYGVEW